MVARIAYVCLDALDPPRLAAFWAAVLGWEVVEEEAGGLSLAGSDPGLPNLDILAVPNAKTVKNRLHLDLRADGATFDAEASRLEALGARRVDIGQGPDVSWIVYADPEGNEFCLLCPTVQEMATGSP